MIKTFENCSPEYQITIICFFIFLTLLYMILVIYEGTGKRQRKMLLQDSAWYLGNRYLFDKGNYANRWKMLEDKKLSAVNLVFNARGLTSE